MKLMTPSDAQKAQALVQHKQVLRVEETARLTSQKNKEYAQAEADFQNLLASQRARWAKEEADYQEWRSRIDKEISAEEDRLAKMVLPAELDIKRAKKILDEAQATREEADKLIAENESLAEKLEDRLELADQAKHRYEEAKEGLTSRERGVSLQEAAVAASNRELTERLATFLSQKAAYDGRVAKERAEVQEVLASVQRREAAIEAKLEEIVEREDAVRIREYKFNSPVKKVWLHEAL